MFAVITISEHSEQGCFCSSDEWVMTNIRRLMEQHRFGLLSRLSTWAIHSKHLISDGKASFVTAAECSCLRCPFGTREPCYLCRDSTDALGASGVDKGPSKNTLMETTRTGHWMTVVSEMDRSESDFEEDDNHPFLDYIMSVRFSSLLLVEMVWQSHWSSVAFGCILITHVPDWSIQPYKV